MTLLPLGAEELRSIGYQAIAGAGHGAGAGGRGSLAPALGPGTAPATNGGHNGASNSNNSGDQDLARPDYSQMVPFKPKVNWRPGEFMLPGGSFPPPPTAQVTEYLFDILFRYRLVTT